MKTVSALFTQQWQESWRRHFYNSSHHAHCTHCTRIISDELSTCVYQRIHTHTMRQDTAATERTEGNEGNMI